MALDSHQSDVNVDTVLWQIGQLRCTSIGEVRGQFEIRLSMQGVVFNREMFTDPEAAAQYAIATMHAYGAR
ncbi:MAG: hypothetical protein ACRD3J_28540 [Thermoanaerobaculia bacterium]